MRLLRRILPIIIGLACFGQIWEWTRAPKEAREDVGVTLTMRSDVSNVIELFYDSTGNGFHEHTSVQAKLVAGTQAQEVSFSLPPMDSLHGLRIDPGDDRITLELRSIRIDGPFRSVVWDARDILQHFTVFNEMDTIHFDPFARAVMLPCTGPDPFMTTDVGFSAATAKVLSPLRPVLLAFVKAALAAICAGLFTGLLLRTRIPRRTRSKTRGRFSIPALFLVLVSTAALYFITFSFMNGIRILDNDQEILVVGTWHHADEVQIYYGDRPDNFDKYHYASRSVVANRAPQLVRITFSSSTKLRHLRFDPGMEQDTVWLDSLRLTVGHASVTWNAEDLKERFATNEHVAAVDIIDERLRVITMGNDPFFRVTEDVGPVFARLNKQSGNGPTPYLIAAIVALFFLLGSARALSTWVQRPDVPGDQLAMAITFAVVISAPLLTMITDTEPVLENTEKRLLAQRPEFELHRALDFPTEYTTYFAENFGLRKVFFRWNSLFHALVLKTSPLPERTLFGKDGFMFFVRPGTMEKYQEICDIPDADLETVAIRLETRRKWLAARGVRYVLMVPPEKSAVYGDKLPDRLHRFGTPSCLDKLLDHLKVHSQLEVVDIRDTLLAARQRHEVYYNVDTHWNPIGAWYGYKELVRVLHEGDSSITAPKRFSDFAIVPEKNEEGDLAVMIGLNDVFTRISPVMISKDSLRARDVPVGSFANSGFFKYTPITKEVPGSTAPRLLVFRDSFSVYMIPSISEHFSRSTYLWTPIFIPQVVIEERPDIVVHEVMELYLSDLLQDDLTLPPTAP